jgi:leader peptidase (prepilin peptidase)/N-methyltransferase
MTTSATTLLYAAAALFGLVVGSFLNVLILRVPAGENWISAPSRCPACGRRLRPLELIPALSYAAQRGRCRACGARISAQYPAVELGNAALWCAALAARGPAADAALVAALLSALLALSVIDARTKTIPLGFNICVLALGAVRLALSPARLLDVILGAVLPSAPMFAVYLASRGRAIGGGDIKLLCAAGVFLGHKLSLLGFVLGCAFGSVLHPLRMKFQKADRELALGPYLSAGIAVCALLGERLLVLLEQYWGLV